MQYVNSIASRTGAVEAVIEAGNLGYEGDFVLPVIKVKGIPVVSQQVFAHKIEVE